MTDEELAAIKARADAATYGPWEVDDATWGVVLRDRPLPVVYGNAHFGIPVDHDAAFIAHSREDIPALLAEVEAWREIGRAVARGFTLAYAEHRNAEVCALCDAQVACDDFGMDSRRDAVGWYEQHIQHTPDCPVTKARALLGKGKHDVTSTD